MLFVWENQYRQTDRETDRQTARQTDIISLFFSMKKVNIKLFINAE